MCVLSIKVPIRKIFWKLILWSSYLTLVLESINFGCDFHLVLLIDLIVNCLDLHRMSFLFLRRFMRFHFLYGDPRDYIFIYMKVYEIPVFIYVVGGPWDFIFIFIEDQRDFIFVYIYEIPFLLTCGSTRFHFHFYGCSCDFIFFIYGSTIFHFHLHGGLWESIFIYIEILEISSLFKWDHPRFIFYLNGYPRDSVSIYLQIHEISFLFIWIFLRFHSCLVVWFYSISSF